MQKFVELPTDFGAVVKTRVIPRKPTSVRPWAEMHLATANAGGAANSIAPSGKISFAGLVSMLLLKMVEFVIVKMLTVLRAEAMMEL